MPHVIRAERIEDLAKVTDWIHDCFFAVDDIRFNAERREVVIPFEKRIEKSEEYSSRRRWFRKQSRSTVRYSLKIYQVHAHEIRDTEGVGMYDFNEIGYDVTCGLLMITTGIPLRMTFQVDRIDVAVEA